MTRINVICEGQTEESFVADVLGPAFWPLGIFLFPSLIGVPGHKGGNVSFARALVDIRKLLLANGQVYCTTFFDYYGMHPEFPGKADADPGWTTERKYNHFCEGFQAEVVRQIGAEPARRFIPYVQMYEFEGLLFSCPQKFAQGIGQASLETPFRQIRNGFTTPEHINDSVATAPAKRILQLHRGYQKPLHGLQAAKEIELDRIRAECRMFDGWIASLEALSP